MQISKDFGSELVTSIRSVSFDTLSCKPQNDPRREVCQLMLMRPSNSE